jgi:hypothetical protein
MMPISEHAPKDEFSQSGLFSAYNSGDYNNGQYVSYRPLPTLEGYDISFERKGIKPLASMIQSSVPYNELLGRNLHSLAMRVNTMNDIVDLVCPYSDQLKTFLLTQMEWKKKQKFWDLKFDPLRCLLEGPSFCEKLKKKRFSFMMDNFSKAGHLTTFDHSYYYFPKYLFPWEESNNDFFEWSYVPVEPLDKDVCDLFDIAVRRILDENPLDLEPIDTREILSSTSGSSSFSVKEKKRSPEWKNQDQPQFSEKLIGQLVPLMKCPGDSRHIVVLSKESKLSITLANRQMARLIEQMPFSAHKKKSMELITKEFSKRNKDCWFYMRDLRKEGLTKPKHIITRIADALEEYYPGLGFSGLKVIANQDFYDIDGNLLPETSRGHGLGMCNELTTFMQIIIHKMIEYLLPGDIDINDALYFNDDSVIAVKGSTSFTDAMEIASIDEQISKGLGILYNADKSFVSPDSFVFCEEYWTAGEYWPKDTYESLGQLRVLLCENIFHAKAFLSSFPRVYPEILKLAISWWGYSYSPSEINWPYLAGGWVTPVVDGLDMTLRWASENWGLVHTGALSRILSWKTLQTPLKNKHRGRWKHPAISVFNITDIIWDSDTKQVLFGENTSDVAKRFTKLSYSNKILQTYWNQRSRPYKPLNVDFCTWGKLVLKNFRRPYSLPTNLCSEVEGKMYIVNQDKFLANFIQSSNSFSSYLLWLKEEGKIKMSWNNDTIKSNRFGMTIKTAPKRWVTKDAAAFMESSFLYTTEKKHFCVTPDSVLNLNHYLDMPEVVADDFFTRHGYFPGLAVDDPIKFKYGSTGLEIEPWHLDLIYDEKRPRRVPHMYWGPILAYNPSFFENQTQQARGKIEAPETEQFEFLLNLKEYKRIFQKVGIHGPKTNEAIFTMAEGGGTPHTDPYQLAEAMWRSQPFINDTGIRTEVIAAFSNYLHTWIGRLSIERPDGSMESSILKQLPIGEYLEEIKPWVYRDSIPQKVWDYYQIDPEFGTESDFGVGDFF